MTEKKVLIRNNAGRQVELKSAICRRLRKELIKLPLKRYQNRKYPVGRRIDTLRKSGIYSLQMFVYTNLLLYDIAF